MAVSESLSDTTRQVLGRSVFIPAWLILIGCILLAPLVESLSPRLRYLPFALSLLIFGLPHGAVDHLTPARTVNTPVTVRSMLSVGGLYLSIGIMTIAAGAWRVYTGASARPYLIDAGEIGLLWAFFIALPPIFAVGVYFCIWHSLRHIARLAIIDHPSRQALDSAHIRPAVWRFVRDAAPLTAAALLFFASLYILVPRQPNNIESLAAFYLVGIAALTAPHVVIVSWMDRMQAVW